MPAKFDAGEVKAERIVAIKKSARKKAFLVPFKRKSLIAAQKTVLLPAGMTEEAANRREEK